MAPNPRRVRGRLDAVYAKLPSIACKGLCATACVGDIDPLGPERDRMREASGFGLAPRADGKCGYLEGERCSVYADRPFICRAWGTVETMPCDHGCLQLGEKLLTFAEFIDLLAETHEAIGDGARARHLRRMLDDDEAKRIGEMIARQGQQIGFDCPSCGTRVDGRFGSLIRCGGCGGFYKMEV